MSRHRDVRSMNYSDEYDGYDDVYGHSVEDDYCVSPGAEQFMYDRNKQQNMASFLTEPDIKEDDEDTEGELRRPELSELDTAKLMSCVEIIRNVIGDDMAEEVLADKIIKADFNAEVALDEILKSTSSKNLPDTPVISQRAELESDSSTGASRNLLSLKPKFSSSRDKNNITGQFSPFSNTKKNPMQNSSNISTIEKNTFTSLSDLMSVHSKKVASPQNNEKFDFTPTKKSFGTLADLTAHHLQKSDGSVKKKSPFVIPKFPSKSQNTLSNFKKPFLSSPSLKTEQNQTDIVETLQKSTLVMKDRQSENKNDLEIFDECIIDLTTALNRTKALFVSEIEKEKPKSLNSDMKEIYLKNLEPIPSTIILKSLQVLECQYSASNLRCAKLIYSTNSGSLFGKILCKRWRPKKPYVNRPESEYTGRIESFNFSSPSPDSIILAHLRRQ